MRRTYNPENPRLPSAQGFRGFESRHLLDQCSRSLMRTAASSSITDPGIAPEVMIVDTNIAISVTAFYPLQGQSA